jgi:hypothetical protein
LTDEPRLPSARVEEETSLGAEYPAAESSFTSERQQYSSDLQFAPTERLPDAFQVEETPAEASNTQSSSMSRPPAAGLITLDQLSPEVIDAIARRAVEQLSERVVEQVAWEVVPELAELLIKRRLEENRSQ